MDEKVLQEARKQIGKYISEAIKEREISYYRITEDTGVRYEVVKKVENGEGGYNIDTLLKLMNILDLYIFFAPREGKHLDIDDMTKKGGGNV